MHELLRLRLGVRVSYKLLHRFVHEHGLLPNSGGTVRMAAVKPGEAAEVDFGYLGRIPDSETGRLRKAWAFGVVLAFSRHMHVTITFKQDAVAAIDALEATFAFFKEVPRKVVLDNFSAAVDQADNYEPRLNRLFAE